MIQSVKILLLAIVAGSALTVAAFFFGKTNVSTFIKADVSSADSIVARIGNEAIRDSELVARIEPELRKIRQQEYELKMKTLQQVINEKLIQARADKKGLTPDKMLETELGNQVTEPTDQELESIYQAQRNQIKGEFADVKNDLRQSLLKARRRQVVERFIANLREEADIRIDLARPRFDVAFDAQRVRGDADAPIVIVEFSDFQCPYCRSVQPTLAALLGKYPGQIKVAFKDFPLSSIHPQAQLAAEAARCAGDQGQFWQFHDRVYAEPSKMQQDDFANIASALNLDRPRFETCVASRNHQKEVLADLQEGTKAGVNGTPAFFINGAFLSGSQPIENFVAMIDDELAALGKNMPSRK